MNWHTKLDAITTPKEQWIFIGITILIAFIFTNVFEPFDIYSGAKAANIKVFFSLNIGLIIALVCLITTQFVLRKILRISYFTYTTMLLWFVLDMCCIGMVWAVIETMDQGTSAFGIAWFRNGKEAFFLLGIPYVLALFCLSYMKKKREVQALQQEKETNTITAETSVTFTESGGKPLLTIALGAILCLEANDNYVTVYYFEAQGIERLVLRSTLKNMELYLQDYTIVRCHRSYLVNIMNITSHKKTEKGFELTLSHHCPFKVPVSKTYVSEVHKLLS